VQGKAQRENIIVEDSVKLCQVGIEHVQGVHEGELCFKFRDKRGVKEKTLTELLNTLFSSTRSA
jgi:hypothetical protein